MWVNSCWLLFTAMAPHVAHDLGQVMGELPQWGAQMHAHEWTALNALHCRCISQVMGKSCLARDTHAWIGNVPVQCWLHSSWWYTPAVLWSEEQGCWGTCPCTYLQDVHNMRVWNVREAGVLTLRMSTGQFDCIFTFTFKMSMRCEDRRCQTTWLHVYPEDQPRWHRLECERTWQLSNLENVHEVRIRDVGELDGAGGVGDGL